MKDGENLYRVRGLLASMYRLTVFLPEAAGTDNVDPVTRQNRRPVG